MMASGMKRQPSSPRNRDEPSLTLRIGPALRRYFITGLATLFPVWVTIYLIVVLFQFVDGRLGRLLGVKVPGLGLLGTVCIILVVGVISIHFFGRVVFTTLELWFSRLPLIKKIYPPIKQLAQFLFSENQQAVFRRVVLVQYPRAGSYTLAFVTNEGKTSATGPSRTLLSLLIPTPPSPFSGPIVFVSKDEVIPLNMSVEDAIKLVVSGGVVAPPLEAAEKKT